CAPAASRASAGGRSALSAAADRALVRVRYGQRRTRPLRVRIPPRLFRWGMNCWPPFLGAGIRVRRIAPDWREVDVAMGLRWYNQNYVRSHFGGSLYAMTDPFYMIMLMHALGPDYIVWDQVAQIEYIAPGKATVHARFRLT